MQANLFFDWLSSGELLTLKTGPPCRETHKTGIGGQSKQLVIS